MRTLLLPLALLHAAPALASGVALTWQGRLVDTSGEPIEGQHTLRASLYSSSSAATADWSMTTTTTLHGGFYSLVLEGTPGDEITPEMLDGDVWIGISVDLGDELLPRQRLMHVPRAAVAELALSVRTGAASGACDRVGAIVFDPDRGLSVCDGTSWTGLVPAPSDIVLGQDGLRGFSDGLVVSSCEAYRRPTDTEHVYAGATGSGWYRLLAGSGDSYAAYCDMISDGGGWTLVMKAVDDQFDYDDPAWTVRGAYNAAETDLTAAGRSKYPAFDEVPFTTLRTSDPGSAAVAFDHTFTSARTSALTVFQGPGVQLSTSLQAYFNDRAPSESKQWGCSQYVRYGLNLQNALGTATIPGGSTCDWNGGARWGQRVNASHGGTGNHTGQGWGAYTTVDGRPDSEFHISQNLWVR